MKKTKYHKPTLSVTSLGTTQCLMHSYPDADAKPHITHSDEMERIGNEQNAPWGKRYNPWETE